MKKLILKRLQLSNWKGQNVQVDFREDATKICGRNGAGKTSLYKAFCWLLSGYTDAENVKNHELFDNTLPLSPDTPEAIVRAIITIDGQEVELERAAKAQFSRERATNEWVKSASDSYTLKIDKIEVSTTEFNEYVKNNIADVEYIPYMLIGERFAFLAIDNKRKARSILENICGKISDDELKGDYSDIFSDIQKYGVEAAKERYKKIIVGYKDRNKEIDSIIKLKTDEISELEQIDFDDIQRNIDEKTAKIAEYDLILSNKTDSNNPIVKERAEISKKYQELQELYIEKRSQYNKAQSEKRIDLEEAIARIDSQNARIKEENDLAAEKYAHLQKKLDLETTQLGVLLEQREELIKKRNEVKSKVFEGYVCSFCGQQLQPEKIGELKNKFQQDRQDELDLIIADGMSIRKRIEEAEKNIASYEEAINAGLQVKAYISKEKAKEDLSNFLNNKKAYEDTDEAMELIKKAEELKSSMPELKSSIDKAKLVSEKKVLMEDVSRLNRIIGKQSMLSSYKEMIVNIHEEQKENAKEAARYEGLVDKISQYVEERANIVSERINLRLDYCKIQMFSVQKDGNIKPDCVITGLDGVKFTTMNNASRILTNISLQKLFCSHYGISLPVFVDEFSIFDSAHRPKIENAQMIYLCASDDFNLIIY